MKCIAKQESPRFIANISISAIFSIKSAFPKVDFVDEIFLGILNSHLVFKENQKLRNARFSSW